MPTPSDTPAPSLPSHTVSRPLWWLTVLHLSLLVTVTLAVQTDWPTRSERLVHHTSVVSGEAYEPDRYQILVPYAVDAACGIAEAVGIGDYETIFFALHLLVRFLCLAGCAWALDRLLRSDAGALTALCGILLYFALQLPAFWNDGGQPHSPLNHLIFFVGVALLDTIVRTSGDMRRKAHVGLLAILAIGLLNQTAPAFLVLAYALLCLPPSRNGFQGDSWESKDVQTENPLKFLRGIPNTRILAAIRGENARTIASVIDYLETDRGMALFEGLDETRQTEVAERLEADARGGPVPIQEIRELLLVWLSSERSLPLRPREDTHYNPADPRWAVVYSIAAALVYALPRYGLGPGETFHDWTYYLDLNLTRSLTLHGLWLLAPVWLLAVWDLHRKPWFMRRLFPIAFLFTGWLFFTAPIQEPRLLLPTLPLLLPAALWTFTRRTSE